MREPAWWKKAVIYELYVDKFAGNFKGLTDKLEYFNYLGVDTLWLLPHYPSPMVDEGYDISDYCQVRSELGTLDDFDRFLASAHDHGLKVITDLVLNHTSSDHPWFRQSRGSRDNPKRDWYMWGDDPGRFPDAFVHFSGIKEKNWIKNEATGDYYYATFYPQQPDLNWDNPEVFEAMMQVVDFWLDRGVDGFRLDAVSRLVKRDGTSCFALPETHAILKRIRSRIDSKYENIVLLAETGGWPHEARPFFGSGDECQMVIHFPLAVHLLSAIGSHDLSPLDMVWQASRPIPENCRWALFLTNHDTVDLFFLPNESAKKDLVSRVDPEGRFSASPGQSFAARLGEVCRGNPDDVIWATSQLLSQPGTPIIYYGNELGMRNADLNPKPEDVRLFVRGNFDWAEADRQRNDPSSVLNQVRQIISERS